MNSLKRKRFCLLALVLGLLTSPVLCSGDSFDSHFRYTFHRFLYNYGEDWYILKAQGIAESNLNPLAVSHAGAMGVMQFMPGTWSDCGAALRINASPHHPRASIVCGGWFMRRQMLLWSEPRESRDRWRWAWASYNWGPGNVLRVQRQLGGPTVFVVVERRLPLETQHYVRRIEAIRARMPY